MYVGGNNRAPMSFLQGLFWSHAVAHGYPLQDHGNANGNGMAQPVDATKIVDQAVEGTQIVGQAPLACIRHS